MVGEVIKNILNAEDEAERILCDAEVLIRKIESEAQNEIERLKVLHAKELHEKIKNLNDTESAENNASLVRAGIDDYKIEAAKNYILSFAGGAE